ncbi:MAG: DUF401 family protein [Nitrospiraceae bacterium]|nr:DUF401 family protein [Nitrospiraceae bacterium]
MTDSILAFPAALKLGIALLGIVALMRARAPMGVALLAGAVFLAILFPMTPPAFAKALLGGLVSDQTVFLLTVITAILIFSGALDASGQIARIIDAFKAMVGESRLTLVTFPALIGLLPMPGGAVFSAPMVKAAAQNADIRPEQATIANYWFRHIWEYWFPIYPGVVLMLTLTRVSTGKFLLMQIPLTLLAVAAGYAIILHRIKLGGRRHRDYSPGAIGAFLRELSPILIVVAAVAVLDPLMSVLVKGLQTDSIVVRRVPVLLGLVLAGAWLFARRGLTWATLGKLMRKRNIVEMALLAAGLMMFKAVLEQSGAVEILRDEFAAWNIPLIVIVCALPLAAGLVVGIAIGYVGASFPLVIALLATIPEADRLPYYCLAYSFGYAGMMLSPVHLCLVLTNEYFNASLLRVYRYLIPLCLSIMLGSLLLFAAYRAIAPALGG